MNKYQEYVEYMAKNNVDFLFGNSSSVHAAIVMSTMLKYAERRVLLYVKNLDGSVFDKNTDFEKELENFLDRNGRITIIVEEDKEYKDSKIYTKLEAINKRKLPNFLIKKDNSSRTFKTKVKEILTDKELNGAFYMVADNKAYRLETDSKEHIAYCNFNDVERAGKLSNVFLSNYSSCPEFFS